MCVCVCLCPQTEVFKGTCISIGITFRQVPASEADAVHVCIETVTPNSPAALADLQRGDRLIAIGGEEFSFLFCYIIVSATCEAL